MERPPTVVAALLLILLLSACHKRAPESVQEPSVPKLPHVPTGKVTSSGLDYKVPLPKEGLVPDKDTAVKVAEVILFRLYGEKNITAQKPYSVTKDENIWWVCGAPPPPGFFGSSFRVAISQQTGAILYLEE